MSLIWDTNIAIYYLQSNLDDKVRDFIKSSVSSQKPILSIISEIEVLCWRTANDKEILILKDFLKDCQIINIDDSIKYKAADIRKHSNIKLPDAIIAATALVNNLRLLTRNEKDFRTISGLDFANPFIQ
jgi:predicted nucleic acid-binding protein